MERFKSREFDWKKVREAFFDGYHRALPVYAAAGNNLIIEHIIDTPEWKALLLELLRPFDVFFVGIHCPLEELEQRERARGNRAIGDARRDFETIHRDALYDLEVESTRPPAENAAAIIAAWKQRRSPSAFERMAESATGPSSRDR
jgi:chloramphenicol 3-O phosphotransferase